jgi:hypothetical protein
VHLYDCPVKYGRAVYIYVMIILYTVGTHRFAGMIVLLHVGGIVSVCDDYPAVYRRHSKFSKMIDLLCTGGIVSVCDDCLLSY